MDRIVFLCISGLLCFGLMISANAGTPIPAKSNSAPHPPFSADKVVKTGDEVCTYRTYIGWEKRRTESGRTVWIARYDKKVLWTLNTDEKKYTEQPTAKPGGFSFWQEKAKTDPSVKSLGIEQVSGYQCSKYAQTTKKNGGTTVETVWVSMRFDLVMKSIKEFSDKSPTITETLTNIVEAPQKDSLFELPVGYKKK